MADKDYCNFVTISRNIIKWEWYTDIPTKVLFFHLILSANWQPGNFRGRPVKRGQIITSLQHLSLDTGLSVQQIRTSIGKLKSTHEITHDPTNQYTMITLCNYDTYNPEGKNINIQANTRSNKRITNDQQTDNKRITTIEEEKEFKKKKNLKDMCDFEEVWNVLPARNGRKLERSQALKKYVSLPLKDRAAILTAATNYANSKQVKCGIGIKDPKRFLNNWKDWYDDEVPTNGATADQIDDIFMKMKMKRKAGI
jgi:hypothetical protein